MICLFLDYRRFQDMRYPIVAVHNACLQKTTADHIKPFQIALILLFHIRGNRKGVTVVKKEISSCDI